MLTRAEPRRNGVSKAADPTRGKPEEQVAQLLNREPLAERPLPAPIAAQPAPIQTESADDDNWDDDFDGPIKPPASRTVVDAPDFDGRTIRAKPVDMKTIKPTKLALRAPVAASSRATPSSSRRKAVRRSRTVLELTYAVWRRPHRAAASARHRDRPAAEESGS